MLPIRATLSEAFGSTKRPHEKDARTHARTQFVSEELQVLSVKSGLQECPRLPYPDHPGFGFRVRALQK